MAPADVKEVPVPAPPPPAEAKVAPAAKPGQSPLGPAPAAGAKRDPAVVGRLIDQIIQQRLAAEKIPTSPLASDAEILRRLFIDLNGKIPTRDRTVAFLDSKETDKRAKLIDELLTSPNYGKHFAAIWTDLITPDVQRFQKQRIPAFTSWLANGFNQGRGWDQMVADMIAAEGNVEKNPAIVYTLANIDMGQPDPAKLTATTARLFLGTQLRCVQCHDPRGPTPEHWKRTDFWGLAAFFDRVRDDGDGLRLGQTSRKLTVLVEGDGAPKGTRMDRTPYPAPVPGPEVAIPSATDPNRIVGKAPAKFLQAEPKPLDQGPYRPHLATWVTSPQNKYFARAAANRLWGHLFGRGIVHPVDNLDDPEVAATHPELLDLLAAELAASGFDLKHLIRCIGSSQVYQRTSRPLPGNEADSKLFSRMGIKVMRPDVVIESLTIASGNAGQATRKQLGDLFGDPVEAEAGEMTFGLPHFLRTLYVFNGDSTPLSVAERNTPDKAIEALYLSALSRRPTPAESKRLVGYVGKHKDARAAYGEIFSALLNSAEFMCNH